MVKNGSKRPRARSGGRGLLLCHAIVGRARAVNGKSSDGTQRDFELMAETNETPAMQNPEKDPEDWTTGNEPMTGPQRSYLQTLCREAKEDFDENLTKAEASKRIEELQAKTGRGKSD
jgi:hypothetical protein